MTMEQLTLNSDVKDNNDGVFHNTFRAKSRNCLQRK